MPENHNNLDIRLSKLEEELNEFKMAFSACSGNKETLLKIDYMEKEIESLKMDSEKHYHNSNALQQTLARLEELTKYLKESLTANQQSTQQLMDKVDKMYVLMLEYLKSDNKKDETKNEISIINDSNKIGKEEDVKGDNKVLEFIKDYQTIIILLVALIIYLTTGHWPLVTSTGATH